MENEDILLRLKEIIETLEQGNRGQAECEIADLYDEITESYDDLDDIDEDEDDEDLAESNCY